MLKLNLTTLKLNQRAPVQEKKEEVNADETREAKAQANGSSRSESAQAVSGRAPDGDEKSGVRGLTAGVNIPAPAGSSDVGDSSPDRDLPDSDSGSTGIPRVGGSLLKGLNLGGKKPTQPKPTPMPSDLDLASLAQSESEGIAPIEEIGSGYADEIPATAPERKLPEGLDEQQQSFVQSLDNIYNVLSDPELFGQMIRMIMTELQSNPQYIQLITDDDVAVMIRGMRESMGLARMRKAEKKRGTTSAKSKKAAESNEILDELNAMAASLGGLD